MLALCAGRRVSTLVAEAGANKGAGGVGLIKEGFVALAEVGELCVFSRGLLGVAGGLALVVGGVVDCLLGAFNLEL